MLFVEFNDKRFYTVDEIDSYIERLSLWAISAEGAKAGFPQAVSLHTNLKNIDFMTIYGVMGEVDNDKIMEDQRTLFHLKAKLQNRSVKDKILAHIIDLFN